MSWMLCKNIEKVYNSSEEPMNGTLCRQHNDT